MPPGFCLRAPLTRAAAVAVLVLSVAMLGAGSARAAKPRVSVLVFGGDGGPEASRHAARVLAKHGLQVVPASAVRAIGARAPGDAAEILRTAMSELHLTAVVMGKVTASHHKHTLQVVVRGADGATLAQTSISAASTRKLTRAVDATLWKKIGGAFRRKRSAAEEDPFASPTTEPLSATPPAPAPAPAPEPTPEPAPAPVVAEAAPEPATAPRPAVITRARAEEVPAEPPARAAQPTAFELALGPGAVYRQLSYLTDPEDALSEFRTKIPAPALAGNLTVFLHLGLPRLGATISAEQAAPTRAATTGNLEYRTFSGDYNGALLFGLPSRYVTVDVSIGGGRQRFALQPVGDAESRPRPIPNVTYDYLRAGLSLHVYTGTPFSLYAGGYYRHVLAAGVIRSLDWFPSATVLGGEGTVGVAWRLLPWFEARLHADVRMYQLHMDPNAGDAHVTDGALDQYWSGGLSFAALFGGRP